MRKLVQVCFLSRWSSCLFRILWSLRLIFVIIIPNVVEPVLCWGEKAHTYSFCQVFSMFNVQNFKTYSCLFSVYYISSSSSFSKKGSWAGFPNFSEQISLNFAHLCIWCWLLLWMFLVIWFTFAALKTRWLFLYP